jgi:hypothetical protein
MIANSSSVSSSPSVFSAIRERAVVFESNGCGVRE